jgi:hypothetical protein
MRTTLDIDDDILSASKELAKAAGKTAGQVLSELARKALTQPYQSVPPAALTAKEPEPLCGIRPFPSRGGIVTNELINRIRDEEGI